MEQEARSKEIETESHLPQILNARIDLQLDEALFAELSVHLDRELNHEFDRPTIRKGQKLFPQGLLSLSMNGDEVSAKVTEKGRDFEVRLTLPVFDWASGYSFVACSCQRETLHLDERRCPHMWLTQKVLWLAVEQKIQLKSHRSDPEFHPIWQALDDFIQEDRSDLPRHEENVEIQERIVWLIDENLNLELRLQKVKGDSWTKGRSMSWAEFLEKRELWQDEVFHQIAVHLQSMIRGGQIEYDADQFAIIRLLKHSDLIYWKSEPSRLVEFVASPLVMKTEVIHQELWIRPFLGAKEVQWVDSDSAILMSLAKEGPSILYAETDRKTCRFVESLVNQEQGVPLSQKDQLFDYIMRLDQKIPVGLPEEFAPIKVSVPVGLVIRLTPFQKGGFLLELLTKPVREGAYFAPGQGPEQVLGVNSEKQPVAFVRDFFAEHDLAERIADRLELTRFRFRPPLSWILPDEQVVLDILDDLRTRPDAKIQVEWPKSDLEANFRQGPELEGQKIVLTVGGKKDWLGIEGGIQVEDQWLNLKELLKALQRNRKYLALSDGRWVKITESLRERLAEVEGMIAIEDEQLRFDPAAMEALEKLEQSENIKIEEASQQWWRLRKNFQKIKVYHESLPIGFQATLRPYQEEGFRWLHRLCVWGMGACLADDMGLGKTVQTLAVLYKHRRRGPSLVIAPSSVVGNWMREGKRFCPDFDLINYRETDRSEACPQFKNEQLVLASYGLVLRDAHHLAKVNWNIVIIDEAQVIKNAKSQTALAIQSLNRNWTLALSGTPVENHLGDLWSLFRTISPGLLGSWNHFRRAYGFPILKGDGEAKKRLKRKIQPFILRRLKKDYLNELPEKTEIDLYVTLSTEEREVYDGVKLLALQKLEAKQNDEVDPQKSLEKGPESNQRFEILGALTRLRLASCHPKLVSEEWADVSSAKLQLLRSLAQQIRANEHRALIFSQFTGFLKMVREALANDGFAIAYLDGQTPVQERSRLVEEFQNRRYEVFLISLKAGGTGLNLTQADVVIHLDPWWNPAVEDQATDRAYRMGQTRAVTVYRLVAERTIEEEILKLHREKRDLADAILNDEGKNIAQLTDQDLVNLIKGVPSI